MRRASASIRIFTVYCAATFLLFSGAAAAENDNPPYFPVLDAHASGGTVVVTVEQLASLREQYDEKTGGGDPGFSVADDGSKKATVKSDWRNNALCRIRQQLPSLDEAGCMELLRGSREEEDEAEPTSVEVLAKAMDSVTIDGAGLVVQPKDWVYLGVPTLAHASTDTIHTSVNVLGLEVPVTMTATNFSFDFNNGAPTVESAIPGEPYPFMEIYGIYMHETDNQTVTLRTTWKAVATHPITGESIEVDGLLTTVEESAPFKVKKRRIRLSRDEDFGKH